MNRRRLLVGAAAATATAIAGCSGSSDDGDTADTAGDTPATEQGEQTATPDPGPTVEEFDYPDGASQGGVSGETLYSTHESTLTGAGSLTLDREFTDRFDGGEFSRSETNRLGSNGILQEVVQSDGTEYVWSPAGEDLSYVEMESGFENGYRIDNGSPDTNRVTGLGEVRRYIEGAEWGEASEVVEAGDEYAVRYESTGYSEQRLGGDITDFSATLTVAASGYVRELSYELSRSQGDSTVERNATLTITSVGETAVDEPDWAATAREEGAQFRVTLSDDGRTYEIEMLNGADVSTDTRLVLRVDGMRTTTQLPSTFSVGDRLYAGLSDSDELLVGEGQPPEGARPLSGRIQVALRSEFDLLEYSDQL